MWYTLFMEKIKAILGTLFIIACLGLIVYCSLIEPVLMVISKRGIFGTIAIFSIIIFVFVTLFKNYTPPK